ncbi:hypothetical protein NPIL_274411 [Nephila pilipes]|uniref:Uncharacterized protein n=1 Tax=Nephila pilipes TaxID=299642 RepID=A0A8X6IMW4_NEPPI|nr:hypothetical protein NPIL_274411 [Nephila pilipes]
MASKACCAPARRRVKAPAGGSALCKVALASCAFGAWQRCWQVCSHFAARGGRQPQSFLARRALHKGTVALYAKASAGGFYVSAKSENAVFAKCSKAGSKGI